MGTLQKINIYYFHYVCRSLCRYPIVLMFVSLSKPLYIEVKLKVPTSQILFRAKVRMVGHI